MSPADSARSFPRSRSGAAGACRGLVSFLVAFFTLSTASAKPLKEGDALPDLATMELTGRLPDYRGRVVLLDIWASWCAPCRASFPVLEKLQQDLGPRGLVLIAVSVDQRSRDFDRFVAKHRPSFAVLRDGAERLAPTLSPPAMPTTYLVDRQGRVRRILLGFEGSESAEILRAAVTSLLEETP